MLYHVGMRVRRAILKVVKWGGTVVAVVFAYACLETNRSQLIVSITRDTKVHVAGGQFGFENIPRAGPSPFVWSVQSGYYSGAYRWWYEIHWGPIYRKVHFPLWLPGMVAALLGAYAWEKDALATRRARIGFCPKCNYDRAGLGDGVVCPECGAGAGGNGK